MWRVVAQFVVGAVVCALLSPAPAGAETDGGPVDYVHPVDAPVHDPFRAPSAPYGPGNRGLEYDTPPGQAVAAAADGEVAFAGPVAGALHVTLRHADGRRTSYSFLAEVEVAVGQRVARGDTLGRTGGRVHVSLREGDSYVDPALFFGVEVTSARLVPEGEAARDPAARALHEVQVLAALTAAEEIDRGRLARWSDPLGALDSALLGRAADALPGLLGLASWWLLGAIAPGPWMAGVVWDTALSGPGRGDSPSPTCPRPASRSPTCWPTSPSASSCTRPRRSCPPAWRAWR